VFIGYRVTKFLTAVNSCITSQRQTFRRGHSGSVLMTGYTQTDTSKSIPARLMTTTMKGVYEKAKGKHFKGDGEIYCKDTNFTPLR
jgi:hypothetical protein